MLAQYEVHIRTKYTLEINNAKTEYLSTRNNWNCCTQERNTYKSTQKLKYLDHK